MEPRQADFIFAAQYLLPTARHGDAISDGALAVAQDTICGVGPLEEIIELFPQTPVIKEEHGLIMPGLVNSHTHAAMSCFRGLADDLPLMDWLERHIFPIEAKLTPDMVELSTTLSIAEMIRSGTTSFCDMYLFSNEVAHAADKSGIRAWIGEVLYDFPSPCYGLPEDGIRYVMRQIETYKENPLVTITVDPHSVYTCSDKLLEQLGQLASDNGCLYVIHLSENDAEVATCLERYGSTPVKHLHGLGLLGPMTLACHCVKLDKDEINLLREYDVKVAHCIESNMKLASGIAPAVDLLKEGVTLSLGTDGSASNNDVDMFSEMNSVAKIHKVACMDPTVMNAEQTLSAATTGGATALGVPDRIGRLATGMQADFIVLDMDQPHMTPVYNLPSHLTYVARGGDVIHSFVAGKQLMKNRELLTIDQDKLLHDMRRLASTIVEMRN